MTAHTHLKLAHHAIFTMPDAQGIEVRCLSGSVWLTLDGDRRDIVLSAGETFRADTHVRALVSALEPSCIAVASEHLSVRPPPPHPARSPWRLVPHGITPA